MPKIIGPYTTVKVGHKVKVENDAKPTFKLAKVAPWYFAVQVKEEGRICCLLMTEAQFKKKLIDSSDCAPENLGELKQNGIHVTVSLFNEDSNKYDTYKFYKNDIVIAKERACKYPHLCTKIGFLSRLFG